MNNFCAFRRRMDGRKRLQVADWCNGQPRDHPFVLSTNEHVDWLFGVRQVPPVGLSSRVPPAGLGMQMRPLSLGAILTQLFICRCRDFFWSGSQLNVSARSRLLVQMDSLSGGDERKDAPLLLAAQLVSPKTGPMNDVA